MSAVTSAPVLADVYRAMRAFIQGVIGTDIPVVQSIQNRESMPLPDPGFVKMKATIQARLRTNIDTFEQIGDAVPTTATAEQGTQVTVQLDFYGLNSGDWKIQVCTLFRDPYGCAALGPKCQPLFADEGNMAPLTDEEMQYEERWTVQTQLQYNPVVTVPQDSANVLKVTPISVDERYPP